MKYLVGAIVVGALGVWLLWPTPKRSTPPHSEPVSAAPATVAPADVVPVQAPAPSTAAPAPSSAAAPVTQGRRLAVTTHLPTSFHDLRTPAAQKAMDALRDEDPTHTQPALADYGLGVLSALNDCVAGRIKTGGVSLKMKMVREAGADHATVNGIEMDTGSLGDFDREIVGNCLKSHAGETVSIPAESTAHDDMTYWVDVAFPVGRSPLYRLAYTGSW